MDDRVNDYMFHLYSKDFNLDFEEAFGLLSQLSQQHHGYQLINQSIQYILSPVLLS